ncbi:MAG: PAS domain S-box protein [Acidobacteria bacterium]|nr:PAS domain S-box protein [Acidobacteriota bacterium]
MLNEVEELRHQIVRLETENNRFRKAWQESREQFYRSFHSASNPLIIARENDWLIHEVNESFAALTGFSREELINRTMSHCGLWENADQKDEAARILRSEGRLTNFKVLIRTKEGISQTAFYSGNIINLNDESCIFIEAGKIPANKEVKETLKRSEEKYRRLVEESMQGLAIVQDSRFVFCNERFAVIFGYKAADLLALAPVEIFALCAEPDRARLMRNIQDCLAGRRVLDNHEYRGIRKDGTDVWVEIDSNVIEYNGKPAVRGVFMDITERKKAAENLERISDWHTAIFEGSRDAILISDSNSMMVDVNAAAVKLTGYSKEELLKMRGSDLNKETDLQVFEMIRSRILSGEDVVGETAIVTKDGRRVDVEFGHKRIVIAGEPYIHSVARDITIRKQLEAQFLQTQKMEAIGVLAGGIARDFNNLLSAMQGYTEIVMEDMDAGDPKLLDLEQIAKACRRGALLTSQLLAFSRRQMVQSELLNLNDIIKNMDPMIRRLIGDQVKYKFKNQSDLGFVNADPGQIQQIVMNLAVNSRDAMPQGGILSIETANVDLETDYLNSNLTFSTGAHVMLAVSDNGSGMDEETQSHIFEPFFTTKPGTEGTGLGLSAVYGIVNQNNGHIRVFSEPGKGTTFKIFFPRAS